MLQKESQIIDHLFTTDKTYIFFIKFHMKPKLKDSLINVELMMLFHYLFKKLVHRINKK